MRLKQISDGSYWNGIKEASDLDWKLRYAPDSITRGDILAAASIIESYVYMIAETTQKKRDLVCRDLRSIVNEA